MTFCIVAGMFLLLGWILGWAHSIHFERQERTDVLEEITSLAIQVESLREDLRAKEPEKDSLPSGTASL